MDFLKIRKKAKERAASQRGGGPGADAPAEPGPELRRQRASGLEAPPAAGLEDSPVLTEADVVRGKLAARLQGLPEPPAGPGADGDGRFTTWRPGTGERPFVPVPEPVAMPQPDASAFAVFDPNGAHPVPEIAPAPSPWRGTDALHPFPAPSHLGAPAGASRTGTAAQTKPPLGQEARDPLEEFFFRVDEEVPALAALPADVGPVSSAGPEDAGVEEYLTFRLGVEEYAVAIERVHEVLKSQPVTEVPRAPAGVLGVVTVRGEVVAVFDPRRRLGLPGTPPPEGSGRIVIVDDGQGPCGLLVDGVASVVRLARGSIEPCPQGIGGASADCLAGIGRERSRLFTVLDLGALLRRAQAPARVGRATHAGS